jgi:hypothetical protein
MGMEGVENEIHDQEEEEWKEKVKVERKEMKKEERR